MPWNRIILAALAALAGVLAAAYLAFPRTETKVQIREVHQAPASQWSSRRFLAEMGDEAGKFNGSSLGLPGAMCHIYSSSRFRRVVLVCL